MISPSTRPAVSRALLLPLMVAAIGSSSLAEGGSAEPAHGFRAKDTLDLAGLGFVGGLLYQEDGRILLFVESELRRYETDGSFEVVAAFTPAVFGSFLVDSPTGTAVIFGENSEGGIYRIGGAGDAPELLDRVPFNYDLAFDPAGRGFVSAFIDSQKVVLLDNDPENAPTVVIEDIEGFSGPVACDAAGDLFYATATAVPEPQAVVRFRQAQLEAALLGAPLSLDDGEIVFSGDVTTSNMRFLDDRLYLSDLGFNSPISAGAVYALDPDAAFEQLDVVAFPHPERIVSPTHVAVLPGAGPFAPGSGLAGGRLAVVYSDFGEIHRLAEITARAFYVRGEVNRDSEIDLSDAVSVLDWLFLGGPAPLDPESADVNSDGEHNLADPIYLLDFLFLGGAPPSPPFPEPGLEPPSE